MDIKVIKFGGTSVGSADRMIEVIDILKGQEGPVLIVLSAMAGTTNALSEIAREKTEALANPKGRIEKLHRQYREVVDQLLKTDKFSQAEHVAIGAYFEALNTLLESMPQVDATKEILALGELISTHLFCAKCNELGIPARLLPALDFMTLDRAGEPDLDAISQKFGNLVGSGEWESWMVTQGYICRDHQGAVDNLKRGGSDYTATILGAALNAGEIQIWTDIDGVRNNDPRLVDQTKPIRFLSYREAAELAYFGAKILHPTCVLPAEKAQVPLRLKYTMEPDKPGTLISKDTSRRSITAVAAKDGITAIKIYSHRMLMAYGFLREVFQVFEKHRTPIDMITTSEVAVSVTIDQAGALDQIIKELSGFAEVEAQGDYSIICIVGNDLYNQPRYVHEIFSQLENIPLRMVSMGGSRYNLSILVKTVYKRDALNQLNRLFDFD